MRFLLLLPFLIIFSFSTRESKKKKLIPPGTTQFNDTLFVDKTEIPNVGWRECLYYLLQVKKDTALYYQMLPDTTVWVNDTLFSSASDYYFRHPGFNDYPVTGISYEQAIEFCKWRTYAANQGIYFKENKIKDFASHRNDKFPIRFYYRLPTKAEWEEIARGKYSTTDFPYGYPDIYTIWRGKKQRAFNCYYESKERQDSIRVFYTAPTKSFFKNSSGVYNIIGNVAEMVSERGTAKGGSFLYHIDSCKITLDQHYSKPERWLGFRCVAVLIK
jgi:formylglycine-generating enzyme required for sulfatase activity